MREKWQKESTNNNNGQQQQVEGKMKEVEEKKEEGREEEQYAGKEGRACAHAQSKMPSPKRIRCVTAT